MHLQAHVRTLKLPPVPASPVPAPHAGELKHSQEMLQHLSSITGISVPCVDAAVHPLLADLAVALQQDALPGAGALKTPQSYVVGKANTSIKKVLVASQAGSKTKNTAFKSNEQTLEALLQLFTCPRAVVLIS